MSNERSATSWAVAARDLFLVAMAVFVVNIVIGILNGADAVEFDRNQILTHVHAGTVGWLTLTIVASAFVLFRAADRRLMLALAVLVPVYVLAFYTGNFAFRAIGGVALLIAIAWLLVWVWQQYLGGDRSLPRLAVTLGLTIFAYGAVVGVLLQVQAATGSTLLPGDAIGAHAAAMTFAYIVLCAMGFLEWRLLGTTDLPRGGLVQVVALFAGGLIASVALLAGATQAGGGIYLLASVVAVALFAVRVWPRALRLGWLDATPARHLAAAAIWVVAAMALFMYVVFTIISDPSGELPVNPLIASDHMVYIGVVTNIVIALVSVLVLRGDAMIRNIIFWGVNLGLLVFVIGLIVDTAEIKRIGAPVMGITLLFALAVLAWRAYASSSEALESGGAELESAVR